MVKILPRGPPPTTSRSQVGVPKLGDQLVGINGTSLMDSTDAAVVRDVYGFVAKQVPPRRKDRRLRLR